MISVSAGLKTEIQKLRGRRLQARCRIDYSDSKIDNTIIGWSSSLEENTYIDQIYNGKLNTDYVWAALDGSWILGTSSIGPESSSEQDLYEIGAWSTESSTVGGFMPSPDCSRTLYGEKLYSTDLFGASLTYPEFYVNFTSRTITEVNISFDTARNEYAVDFDIVFFDSTNTIVDTISITNNTAAIYISPITPLNTIVQMGVIIKKWSVAYRQAKIAEMYTSIFEMYTGSDIMNIRILENRELPEDGVPLGSTASGQCVITLYNKNNKFDYDNTASKLYSLIREGVRIIPEIGNGTEWIPLGTYYAKSWDVEKNALSVTVTGLDRMAYLGESEFTTSTIIQSPVDETTTINDGAEWSAGTLDSLIVDGNTIKLVFS